jgi:hypothetical protein
MPAGRKKGVGIAVGGGNLGSAPVLTKEQQKIFETCARNPLYFMQNYIKINVKPHGATSFKPFSYQRKFIRAFLKGYNIVGMLGRQLGKTTIVAALLLWKVLFFRDTEIAIFANTLKQALEVMDRIRYMNNNLPDFLRQTPTIDNRSELAFAHASRIFARATSPDAPRGISPSIVYVDEMEFVEKNMQEKFWTALAPTISAGGQCIVTSTPSDPESVFSKIWEAANRHSDIDPNDPEYQALSDKEKKKLEEVGENGFYPILATWREHPDRDEHWKRQQIAAIGEAKFLQEHECEFITTDDLLVNIQILTQIKPQDPLIITNSIRWFKMPERDKIYIIGLDPALGVGGTSRAAIQVVEIPTLEQVGEWVDGKAKPAAQAAALADALVFLHHEIGVPNENIFWSFENNNHGMIVFDYIDHENNQKYFSIGYRVDEPASQRSKNLGKYLNVNPGLRTGGASKISGCNDLRNLIEQRRLILKSKSLLSELRNFTATGASYKARQGYTDDLVMAMIQCVRMMRILSEDGTIEVPYRFWDITIDETQPEDRLELEAI